MAITVLMFLAITFLPRLMVLLADNIPFLNTLGTVFLCYVAGFLLSFPFKAAGADIVLASDFASVLVCIGMPLILFSADIPALRKLAKPMIVSFSLNTISVIIVAIAAFFIFISQFPDAHHISGMLIGTYTGGTPNMIAIGNGLGSSPDRILLLQASDMIGGGIYFFMLLSVMPRMLKKVLPQYQPVGGISEPAETERYAKAFSGEKQSVKPFKLFMIRLCLVLLAIGCVAIAMGIALLLPSRYGNTGLAKLGEHTAVIMLIVTSLGIAFSFVKKVRNAPGSYSSGQYFILMFSVVMGLCFDTAAVHKAIALLLMLLVIQFGTVLLHIVSARIFKIDYHTMMITSTAGVFGPAFIIPVARALKNDEIILPGILCGILGYALGNYLGIGIGELLRLFM